MMTLSEVTPQRNQESKASTSLFISYSKHDKDFADTLQRRLKPLVRQGKVETFYDQDLLAGADFDAEIKRRLGEADIILLLVSPDFLATDYIMDVEVPLARQRYEAGQASMIPIILRPGDAWQDEPALKDLNALPNKGKPISHYPHADDAWNEVVNKIKEKVDN